jgi:hypothetical protein
MISAIGRSGKTMARSEIATVPAPGSEAAGTITIDVAAKLLMVTPEWVRRLTKVPLAEAMTLVDEVCGAVVARVNAIPARFTRNIEQRAALQREVDEALAEVANRIEKLGATFQSGRDDPAADEEEAA